MSIYNIIDYYSGPWQQKTQLNLSIFSVVVELPVLELEAPKLNIFGQLKVSFGISFSKKNYESEAKRESERESERERESKRKREKGFEMP